MGAGEIRRVSDSEGLVEMIGLRPDAFGFPCEHLRARFDRPMKSYINGRVNLRAIAVYLRVSNEPPRPQIVTSTPAVSTTSTWARTSTEPH